MKKEIDLLDVLLDNDNKDAIVFTTQDGREITFEQVAVIPYGGLFNSKLYCLLKPLDGFEVFGCKEDEVFVFFVDEDDNGEEVIRIETDEELITQIMLKYYDLLEEEDDLDEGQREKVQKLRSNLSGNKN